MFDYSKLRGKIREVFHTEGNFAKELGLSKVTISAKLNGRVEFSHNEIAKMASLLGIAPENISDIFFAQKLK